MWSQTREGQGVKSNQGRTLTVNKRSLRSTVEQMNLQIQKFPENGNIGGQGGEDFWRAGLCQ